MSRVFRFLGWLFWLALLVVPTVVLAIWFFGAFLVRANQVLAQSAPVASAELTTALKREVRIGALSPNLTVQGLWEMATHRGSLGTLPIIATDVHIARGATIAGSGELGSAHRIRAFVVLPTLLAGDINHAFPRIVLESPTFLLTRSAQGRFNFQDLLPPPPTKAAQPPFRTFVAVEQGRLRYEDSAARFPAKQLPIVSELQKVNGSVDLTEARRIRLDFAGRPIPGTPTAQRLSGTLAVQGELGRDDPGSRPDAPDPESASQQIRFRATGADVPFWVGYFVPITGFHLNAGRGDAVITLAFPRSKPGLNLPLNINVAASFQNGGITLAVLPMPFENVTGNVRYANGSLSVDTTGTIFGETAQVHGDLWDLGGGGAPHLAFQVNAPRLPVQRALNTFFPPGRRGESILPPRVTIGGIGSVSGTVEGVLTNPVIVAQATLPLLNYQGLPNVRNLTGRITYAQGQINTTNLNGQIEGGGAISGQTDVQLGTPKSAGGIELLPVKQRKIAFSVRAADVAVSQIDALRSLTKNATTRLRGTGNIDVVGTFDGTGVTAAANVTTKRVSVGNLTFSDARARVQVAQNHLFIPALSLLSSAGNVQVNGDVQPGNKIALRFTTTELDLNRIATALGRKDFGGLVSASGRIKGTIADPLIAVNDLRAVDLHFQQFRADTINGTVTATRNRLALGNDVVINRFPTSAQVRGSIAAPLSPSPRLDLAVRLQRLDFAELAKQVQLKAKLPFTGLIADATARITGSVQSPRAAGTVTFNNILVGDYPLNGGSLRFTYDHAAATIPQFTLAASVGQITGSARLASGGKLSGAFRAENLDMKRLSFLTQRFASLDGRISLLGNLAGSITRPLLTAQVTPSTLIVAGTTLNNFSIPRISAVYNTKEGAGRITVPELSFNQGDSRVSVQNTTYDFKSGQVGTNLSVATGDVGVLLKTVRNSGLSDTEAGANIVNALNKLPSDIGGQFVIDNLAVRGRVAKKGVTDLSVAGALSAKDAHIGRFTGLSLGINASYQKDFIRLTRFNLSNVDTTIIASGTVDLNGDVNLAIDSNEASLDLVREFVPNFPIHGTVNLTATAKGSRRSPTIEVSIDGRDIQVGDKIAAATGDSRGNTKGAIPISLVRLRGQITPTPDTPNEGRITILDTEVDSGDNRLTLSGNLPFSYTKVAIPFDRPIDLTLNAPKQDLDILANFAPGFGSAAVPAPKPTDKGKKPEPTTTTVANNTTTSTSTPPSVGAESKPPSKSDTRTETTAKTPDNGFLEGSVQLAGTLQNPVLSGGVRIANAAYTLPHLVGQDRDRISPIRNLDVALRFAGAKVIVDNLSAVLGGLNNKAGDYGSLTATGSVTLSNLQNLLTRGNVPTATNGVSANQAATSDVNVGDAPSIGSIDLTAKLNNLRPAEDNFLGGSESAQARLNGILTIRGALEQPVLATPANSPIVLSDTLFALPTKPFPVGSGTATSAINPQFDLHLNIDNKATLALQSSFRFDADGLVNIGGSLASPDVRADLTGDGGFYQYATARFKVDKGGTIRVTLGSTGLNARVDNLVAKATVYAPSGVTPTLSNRASDNTSIFATSTPSATGNSSRYRITITLNGPLELGATSEPGNTQETRIDFSSEPPLDRSQIIALIGTQQQIQAAAQGNIEQALQQGLTQAFTSNVVPSLLSGVEQSLTTSLGLEEFGLDYGVLDPNAPLTVSLLKRFPEPFSRFYVGYTRTVQTRSNQLGVPQPYQYRLYYELYQLKQTGKVRPRLQIGVSDDEQRNFTYFLRGTFNY